jgi:hypothetical protein
MERHPFGVHPGDGLDFIHDSIASVIDLLYHPGHVVIGLVSQPDTSLCDSALLAPHPAQAVRTSLRAARATNGLAAGANAHFILKPWRTLPGSLQHREQCPGTETKQNQPVL